jgi:hypothetical protein
MGIVSGGLVFVAAIPRMRHLLLGWMQRGNEPVDHVDGDSLTALPDCFSSRARGIHGGVALQSFAGW